MCSYFFCPVEKLAVMNRNLLEKKTSVCNENANYSGFILPNKFRLKFGSFSKSWINDAKCEKKRNWKLRENLFHKETKIWAAGLKRMISFMDHIYHKEVGEAELGSRAYTMGHYGNSISVAWFSHNRTRTWLELWVEHCVWLISTDSIETTGI